MSKGWHRVHTEPNVQTLEAPLHPESVEQIKSNDARQMLKHANQQLELTRAYPGRVRWQGDEQLRQLTQNDRCQQFRQRSCGLGRKSD
jgi:hypothetical protein